uniref:DUF19 domain-containing protein n=1 Tax=Strongyloides venezuelensis TaxID=75913 RepID=A0A0K0F1M2_STRVS
MKSFNNYFLYILIRLLFVSGINSLKEFYTFLNSTKCNESLNGSQLDGCCRPLVDLWGIIRSNELYASDILLPVPFYKTESIVLLCRSYTSCKNNCFDDSRYSSSCSSMLLKDFFHSQLDYFCGSNQGIKYWSEFSCLRNLLLDSVEKNNHNVKYCFEFIKQNQKYKNQEDKCENIEYFMKCLTKHVKSTCGIHTLKILSNTIKVYGCLKNDKTIFKRATHKNYGTSNNVRKDNDMILKYIEIYTNISSSTSIIDNQTINIIKKYLSSKDTLKKNNFPLNDLPS